MVMDRSVSHDFLTSKKSKMVPTNGSTSKPKPLTPKPCSSSLQFMNEIFPNPNSNFPLPSQSQSPSLPPSDRGRESQDGNVDPQIAHHHQQLGLGLGLGLGSPGTAIEIYDVDTDTIITQFFDDPNFDLRGLGHHGSTSKRGERGGQGFLKRGIDISGSALSMDDNASAKRNRINIGNDDHFDAVKFGYEFENTALVTDYFLSEENDQRGKRKLGDESDDSSSSERVGDDYGDVGQRRFSREEKMKEPLNEIDFLATVILEAESQNQNSDDDRNLDIVQRVDDNVAYQRVHDDYRRNRIVEKFREIAKENASRFARFAPDVQDDGSSPVPEVEHEIDDSPTPFSTAWKTVKDRWMKATQKRCAPACITWVPKRNHEDVCARLSVPSLEELCLKVLANNADAIVSLDGVPDELRHRLSQLLCDSRKINSHFFELLVSGSPTEIRLKDCSWLSEEQFTKSFQTCDTARLEVLQLDQCGRCISDYALHATLAQSPMARLTSLSLSGACRLSDKGLSVLVSSAPVLRSINLSQCSLLTSACLNILADSLGSLLKELYLDDCQLIDAALIVPALKELEHLEVLSMAGIQTVCDEFIKDYIIARGHNMKELVLKDCIKLTDASMKVIAEHCPGLCVLDLMNLSKLTDSSIRYLTNNCRALHTLKLCRNPFSDEAIAAFLETTGESLKELSLNNIKKVGHHTTLSLASHAKNLHTLDLSWCRNLKDDELGLIVDSCFSLRFLKLFGCTQVTDVFLNGHSNPEIQLIGPKMSPLLQHLKVADPHQGALRYSSVSVN
ncbi:uncharacterized protein LOC133305349 [Gastrolobium bilobum]|uniref:uncharacterized protein LOC133305349 n=1 Tax=Gastrolobium bilobum TaxID=150636 RepID=UPI002AB0E4F9|nr:uncharacterized protein LOC133305349 [Gastrolobium bilobum]